MMEQATRDHTLILVIDDNPRNIAVVVDCLSAQGFEIITARNGETGIKRAMLAQPDLIVLDVMMPGIDGFETCRQLKAHSSTCNIPVLFMTVADDLDNKMRGFAAGGVDYISKPVQVEEVLARVNAHLTIQCTQAALRQSEARYRALVDHSLQGVLVFQAGRVVFANPAAVTLIGYALEELMAMSADAIDALVYADDLPMIQRYRAMRLAGEPAPARYEFRAVRKDGSLRWIESFNVLIEYQGRPAVQMTYIDITERKHADERIQQMNAHLARSAADMECLTRMSSTLQRAPSRQAVVECAIPFLRDLFCEATGALYLITADGVRLEQVAVWGDSRTMSTLFYQCACQHLAHMDNQWQRLLRDAPDQELCEAQAGQVRCHCVPLTTEGAPLGILQIRQLRSDAPRFQEQQSALATMAADLLGLALTNIQLRENLHDQSIRDPLTRLYNRRYLDEALTRELHHASRHQRPTGIVMMDIDHFKHVNDTYGHQVGDAVLRLLGTFLQSQTRKSDLACRYGGEEILLVLPDTPLEYTGIYAERLREHIQHLKGEEDGQSLPPFTVSVGVAASPHHGTTADTLIPAADQALYHAKATGRNRVCIAETEEAHVSLS